MRTLVPAVVVCLAFGAVSGCSDPVRAPLDVKWSFGGLDCDQVGVATIHLQMDRELLNPNDYSCFDSRGNVTTGAHLGDFLLGDYQLTVIGLDVSGTEILRGTRTAHVARGNNLVEVDIGGSVTLRWTFGGGLSCAQAGGSVVNLRVHGSVITRATANPANPRRRGRRRVPHRRRHAYLRPRRASRRRLAAARLLHHPSPRGALRGRLAHRDHRRRGLLRGLAAGRGEPHLGLRDAGSLLPGWLVVADRSFRGRH